MTNFFNKLKGKIGEDWWGNGEEEINPVFKTLSWVTFNVFFYIYIKGNNSQILYANVDSQLFIAFIYYIYELGAYSIFDGSWSRTVG